MEKLASHMKLTEWKQSSLCKAHEQLHSEASSFLLFSLQWKDLETHFDSTLEMIRTQYEELEGREKAISLKEERLDALAKSFDECSKELQLKKNELSELNGLIEKRDGEVRLKEKELDLAQERLGILSKDVKLKEDEVSSVRMRILDAEKEFGDKEKAFDMIRKRIDDFEQVMELKEQRLNEIMMLMEERSMECEFKGKNVESIRALLKEHEEELITKEKQYDAIQMAIREINGELKLKEKELETIQNMIATRWKEKRLDKLEKTIKLRSEELDLKEKEFGSMKNKLKDLSEDLLTKESELESIKTCIKEHSKELDVQEKQLDGTQQSIRDCENAVMLLTKYVSSIEKAIIECSKEWELNENHVDSLQESQDDYSNELPSVVKQHNTISLTVDKCLEGLKSQQEHFNLLRKSIEDGSKNLRNEEDDFERRIEELNKKDEKVSMYLKEIESLKADMASQMTLLEKGREELRLKEILLEKGREELRLKEILLEKGREEVGLKEIQHKVLAEKLKSKEKDIIQVSALMEKCNEKVKLMDNPNIHHLRVKSEESGCRPADSSNTLNFHRGSTVDGKLLLVLLCEHLKLHDLVRTELVITLQESSDPAKLVLDAMRWFYPPHMASEDAKNDLHNVKRGCIFLCELLFKVSPQVSPSLKEEALKLAGQWKAKMPMAVENHMEVVAFLLLVTNYGLASDFNADELQSLLTSVSQYKQAFDLARALGIADKSSEGSTTPSLVKLEQPDSLPTNEAWVSSLTNEQHNMDPNERRLYVLLNKQLTGQKLIPSAILSILKESSDPSKLVLDMIQGSFHQHLKKVQICFEESFLVWSTFLLKQLKQMSPSIDPKVREDALKLAVDWKLNLRSDANDSLDAVGFLQLLVSYGLTTSFSGDEILKLFENIVLHEQASELCLMFGYNQKIQEMVQNLIGTKQFVKAVRFICGYKLEFFRPVQILNEYLRDARNATAKASQKKNTGQEDVRAAMDDAIDKEIDAVKSVISCVVDCNLGSEISLQGLGKRIVSLEQMRRLKCNSHGQPPSSTMVNKANFEVQRPQPQPHPPNRVKSSSEVQRPQPSKGEMPPQPQLQPLNRVKSSSEVQRPQPTKGETPPQPPLQPPNWVKSSSEAQQLHPTHQPRQQHPPPTHQPRQQHSPPTHQPRQPHPPPTHQPRQPHPFTYQPHQQHPLSTHQQHPSNIAVPQLSRKKKRKMQFLNGSMKYPRKAPPTRPVFSGSSPRVHDEKSKFPPYNSRISGMHGLFGLHEGGGHESTEHGNHYTRPTRPRP